jgi:hypothetical protein
VRDIGILDNNQLAHWSIYLFNLGASASSQAGGEGGPRAHKQKKKIKC